MTAGAQQAAAAGPTQAVAGAQREAAGGHELAATGAQQAPAAGQAAGAAGAQQDGGPGMLEGLRSCWDLNCVKWAHTRPREPGAGRFNFPHFLVLGFPKAATTSLYFRFAAHPQVVKPLYKVSLPSTLPLSLCLLFLPRG